MFCPGHNSIDPRRRAAVEFPADSSHDLEIGAGKFCYTELQRGYPWRASALQPIPCLFHIDGAYGALGPIAALHKFPGIDRADSISLDPHKWLYQSIDCGFLLVP